MGEVRVLKDVLNLCSAELSEALDPVLSALFLYGSFAYQDLDRETSEFSEMHGRKGCLDKKPDFIAVVSNLETALRELARQKSWKEKDVKKAMALRWDTPFYFNLKTNEPAEVMLRDGPEEARLPYKVGIIWEKVLLNNGGMSKRNIYLASRLSKPFNVMHADEEIAPKLEEQIGKIRDYFVDLALKTLPRRFTGEQFAKRYLQVTYFAEAYRIFDIVKAKHIEIFESQMYDLKSGKYTPMRDVLEEMLAERIAGREDVRVESGENGFYETQYSQEHESRIMRTLPDFTVFNLMSLNVSLGKNRITNSIGGASWWDYLKRKFRKK